MASASLSSSGERFEQCHLQIEPRYEGLNDRQLVKLCYRKSNIGAFDALYKQVYNRDGEKLQKIIRQILKNGPMYSAHADKVEDIFYDALSELWVAIKNKRLKLQRIKNKCITSFVEVIAIRKAWDYNKKVNSERKAKQDLSNEESVKTLEYEIDDPYSVVSKREEIDLVEEACKKCIEESKDTLLREAVKLRREGLGDTEIANILRISRNKVYRRIKRGTKLLRKWIFNRLRGQTTI